MLHSGGNMTSNLHNRVLSPLLEGSEGEEELRPPVLEDFIPKESLLKLKVDTNIEQPRDESHDDHVTDEIVNGSPHGADCLLDVDGENLSDEDDFMSDGSLDAFVASNTSDFDTDLDINTEEILKQKKPDFHDTTGKTRYIQVCSDMGIRPVSYFVKNLEQKELKLRFHGLDLDSVKAISIPLQTNTNIEKLNLEGNGIDVTGAKCLCRVLRENPFLTEVVLAENRMGTEGAIALCQFLKHNRNLHKVDLTSNEIGDQVGPSLYEVFKENKMLKELVLSNNKLEENSAQCIKLGIQENDTIETLNLSWNHFKTRGAVAICEGLEENVGLKKFKFQMAGLDKAGADAMMKVLKKNRTLLELDIRFNRIRLDGAQQLAAGLRENDVLQTLKSGNNPFDSDGAMVILEAVDANESSAIKHLDFSNILVKREFACIEERLKEQRGLSVKSEGVLPDLHPKDGTFARLSAFRRDPINTFKKYAEFAGVKLDTLFNGGQRLRLDSEEFKGLILDAGIEIPKQHLVVLCRTLEENGAINYWKLLDDVDGKDQRSDSIVSFASDVSAVSSKSAKPTSPNDGEKRAKSAKRTKPKPKDKKTPTKK